MSFLPARIQALVSLMWDSLATALGILFARLAPNLKIPYTDLTGKVAVITGANSGIGHSLAVSLVKRNATVYLACRNVEKGSKAVQEILDTIEGANSKQIFMVELDTSSLKSVRELPKRLFSRGEDRGIDILIHNAGATTTSEDDQVTDEGLGTIYTTNFLGSFLLTSLLEKDLQPNARVIFTSSVGNYSGDVNHIFELPNMDPSHVKLPDSALYADTKACQIAFVRLLQKRFDRIYPNKHIITHAFSPGYTSTPIFDKTSNVPFFVDPVFWVLKAATVLAIPVEQGAATGLWLATTDDKEVVGESMGGGYWDRCVQRTVPVQLLPSEQLQRLWQMWERHSGSHWVKSAK